MRHGHVFGLKTFKIFNRCKLWSSHDLFARVSRAWKNLYVDWRLSPISFSFISLHPRALTDAPQSYFRSKDIYDPYQVAYFPLPRIFLHVFRR